MGKLSLNGENPPRKGVQAILDWLASFSKDVTQQINGNLTFQDNIKCEFLQVSFTTANTDMQIRHRLGRVPAGFLLVSSNAALMIYQGSQAMTSETVTFRGSAVAAATILIF